MLTIGSLFSGIGGLELGLERAGLGPVIWQAESDEYARKVLAKHWPGVPIYKDVRDIDESAPRAELICGGFPCQDISFAGNGAGLSGERSGLWSEYLRIIRAIRPNVVLVENVPALFSRGLGRVLGDLAESGYDTEWDCIPAVAVGAPHVRDRAWIVAYPDSQRRNPSVFSAPGLRPISRALFWEPFRTVDNGLRVQEYATLCGVLDGLSSGVDGRFHAIGNAVVPQVSEWIGRRIVESLSEATA